jgi:uncharacterized protein (TIGR02246 family)
MLHPMDRFFTLSDQATHDEAAFQELITLFTDDASLVAADGSVHKGKEVIERFFCDFFDRNVILRHVWEIRCDGHRAVVNVKIMGIKKPLYSRVAPNFVNR